MAQDGHQANQGAGNGHGAAPASPCESTNLGTSWTPAPAEVQGEEGDGYGGGKDSTTDTVMAADDVTQGKVAKGKRKAAANEKAARQIITGRERRAKMKKMYDELRCLVPNVDKKTDEATVVGKAISFIKQLEETVQKLEKQKQERELERQGTVATADIGAGSSSPAPPPPPVTPWAILSGVLSLPQGWGWLPKKRKQEQQPGAVAAAPPLLTWSRPNVSLCVIGDEAHINVRAPRLPGVLQLVVSVLEKHHIDIITAQIYASSANQSICSFFTRVNVETINQLDPEAPESKDIYQLAMSEIIIWLNNY